MTDSNDEQEAETSSLVPPSFWQALRKVGTLPIALSAILGAPSYLDVLAYFFKDIHYGVIVERMLANWRLINLAVSEVLSPVTDFLVFCLNKLGLNLALNDIWMSFFWLAMLPGFAFMKIVWSQSSEKLNSSLIVKVGSFFVWALAAFLLSFSAGIVPNTETIFGQVFVAVIPILLFPFIAVIPLVLLSVLQFVSLVIVPPYKKMGSKIASTAQRTLGNLHMILPGWSAFRTTLLYSGVIGSITGALVYFHYPDNQPALFVYFVVLMMGAVYALTKAPAEVSRTGSGKGQTTEYVDVRPVGALVLGGCIAAWLIFIGDYLVLLVRA